MNSILKSTIKSRQKKANINTFVIKELEISNSTNKSLSFSKNERLCSIIAIDQLYELGSSVMSFPLRATMLVTDTNIDDAPPVKVVISVSKKRFKRANKRNYLKRRIREAYRHNKGTLYDELQNRGIHLNLSINYITNDLLEYEQINKAMEKLIQKILKSNLSHLKAE